jgi:hypothetical protein
MATKSKVEGSRKKTGGRKAGTPNKMTAALKEDILSALAGVGGAAYLESVAKSHPPAFLGLIGKVLPMTITGPNQDGSHTFTVNQPWLQQQIQARNSA